MAVKRRRHDADLFGDLTDAEAAEVLARAHEIERGIHERAARALSALGDGRRRLAWVFIARESGLTGLN
jgi:hypothetical protein